MSFSIEVVKNLFAENQTVAAISFCDYLSWAASPEAEIPLALPPIQRGFVWKAWQIQTLWDSLLRGMPIGSILIKSFNKGEQTANLVIERHYQSSKVSGYHLIDGQQRTLSMLIGFPQNNSQNTSHKLWVDFSEAGKNGALFQLRVSTPTQPFGYGIDGRKLSLHDRREAWNLLKNKNVSLKDIFHNCKPYKSKNKLDCYLFEIHELWDDLLDMNMELACWKEAILDKATQHKPGNSEIVQRIDLFGECLINLQKQSLALIKIPDNRPSDNGELDDPAHDYLTLLFDRISSNGTRLSPEDLLFSMIKQSWPEAHKLVYKIHERVGAVMKPTDFVMTAYRLALLREKQSITDDPRPNAKSFHKHLAGLLGTHDNPSSLRSFISEDDSEKSKLVEAFEKITKTIGYKGNEDYAIPMLMFPYLNVPLLQVLVYWALDYSGDIDEANRKSLVRFVMYWLVCNKNMASQYEASKEAIAIINENKGKNFPALEIYKALSFESVSGKPGLFTKLVSSNEFSNKLPSSDLKAFRTPFERAEHFMRKDQQLYLNFTQREWLLLWFQRRWSMQQTDELFNAYKPLAGEDQDVVPYDFDHLVPKSNWDSFHGVGKPKLSSQTNKFNELWPRRGLGNSIGNYRVMTASANRERSDTALSLDLLSKRDEWESYSFAPNTQEEEYWRQASPQENATIWEDKRVLAFQYAVEQRVLYLYRRYFKELGFEEWCESLNNIKT